MRILTNCQRISRQRKSGEINSLDPTKHGDYQHNFGFKPAQVWVWTTKGIYVYFICIYWVIKLIHTNYNYNHFLALWTTTNTETSHCPSLGNASKSSCSDNFRYVQGSQDPRSPLKQSFGTPLKQSFGGFPKLDKLDQFRIDTYGDLEYHYFRKHPFTHHRLEQP